MNADNLLTYILCFVKCSLIRIFEVEQELFTQNCLNLCKDLNCSSVWCHVDQFILFYFKQTQQKTKNCQ